MISMDFATIVLGPPGKPLTLTPEQRARAEATMRRWFGVAKQLTQAQCDRLNAQMTHRFGYGKFVELFPGWYTFLVNAKGEYVCGCGDYPSRDDAIWDFHRLHTSGSWTAEDEEQHRRDLGFPPSSARRAA